MIRPIRPSSGALKFRANCCAFRATAIRVIIIIIIIIIISSSSSSSSSRYFLF
jgi:hypothetical protein